MKCPKCGAPVAESDKFCRTCGAEILREEEETEVPPIDSTLYGVPPGGGGFGYGAPPFGGNAYFTPMRWYKFLIYVALFVGAVLNTLSAFTYFSGFAYMDIAGNNVTSLYYQTYPGLQIFDMIYAALLIGISVFAVYTRFSLAQFKKAGPKMLLIYYGVSNGVSLVYEIGCAFFAGTIQDPLTIASLAMTVLFTVIIMILNNIYFEKRAHLFVN